MISPRSVAIPRRGESVASPRRSHAPLILLYHRIADDRCDPLLLCVSRARFADHMDAIRRAHRIIALRDLVAGMESAAVPDRAVVITFDDGYADNLTHALPVLNQFGAPATIFVASAAVGCPYGFWWDELEAIILRSAIRAPVLRLTIDGQGHEWSLCDDFSGKAKTPGRGESTSDDAWNVLSPDDPTRSHSVYRQLFDLIRPLPVAARNDVLDQLRNWSGAGDRQGATNLALDPDQLCKLARNENVEIGAHTVNHPVLGTLSPSAALREIAEGKQQLEHLLGRTVTSFAYPFGTRRDYRSEHVAMVQNAGFSSACSNFPGVVTPDGDRRQWPRVLVRDWDADTLLRHIDEVLLAAC